MYSERTQLAVDAAVWVLILASLVCFTVEVGKQGVEAWRYSSDLVSSAKWNRSPENKRGL